MIQTDSSPVKNSFIQKNSRRILWTIGVILLALIPIVLLRDASRSSSNAAVPSLSDSAQDEAGSEKSAASAEMSLEKDATKSEETPRLTPEKLAGRWRLNDKIVREIMIHPDGTAVMVCKLDFLSSLLYGSELTMNLNWTLVDDILTHTVTSGVPQNNVDRLTQAFGDTLSYRVLKADQNELVLEGPLDSKKIENWQALPPAPVKVEQTSPKNP